MNNVEQQKMKPNKDVIIFVNGTQKTVDKGQISYREVVTLAFGSYEDVPTIVYTVLYSRGHGNKPTGTLVDGESVRVKKGMIFNVTRTDKS